MSLLIGRYRGLSMSEYKILDMGFNYTTIRIDDDNEVQIFDDDENWCISLQKDDLIKILYALTEFKKEDE